MLNVAINGFGRIGRRVLSLLLRENYNIVKINDPTPNINLCNLYKYDSNSQQPLGKNNCSYSDNSLTIQGREIATSHHSKIEDGMWDGVELLIDSSGKLREYNAISQYIEKGGAEKVIVTTPSDSDIAIVYGVNHMKYRDEKIISTSSCTTNSIVPIIEMIHNDYQIEFGFLTTIHAYTNDQRLHDSHHADLRRGRAAALNIVPTKTGASSAINYFFPDLNGKFDGHAIRVPVALGSLSDIVLTFKKHHTVDELNALIRAQIVERKLEKVVYYNEEPIVSSDVVGSTHSAIYDATLTKTHGRISKLSIWYDNETGYSARVVDIVRMIAEKKGEKNETS